jgi:hypothetical protein
MAKIPTLFRSSPTVATRAMVSGREGEMSDKPEAGASAVSAISRNCVVTEAA